jgi:hypothetical protein
MWGFHERPDNSAIDDPTLHEAKPTETNQQSPNLPRDTTLPILSPTKITERPTMVFLNEPCKVIRRELYTAEPLNLPDETLRSLVKHFSETLQPHFDTFP